MPTSRSALRAVAHVPDASRAPATRRVWRHTLAVVVGLAAAFGSGHRPPEPRLESADATAALAGTGLTAVAPERVGMSAERLAALDRVVARGIVEGGYPGAALVVGRRGRIVVARGYGAVSWGSGSAAVTPDSVVYDLASLTKAVGTTSAVMALVDDGRLVLDAPVRRYVPAFRGPGKEAVTVRHLLEHRSGLAPGAALRRSRTPAEARRRALAAPLHATPGRWVEYSDLGMIVLGFVVEGTSGEPLDAYLQRRVFGPLGMRQTTFRPARSARLAPTGGTAAAVADGRVHDSDAAALGGVSGHAGLFSTAADLAVYAQTLLAGGVGPNGVRVFADSTVRAFLLRGAGGTRRALGWETCGTDRDDVCGRLLDERAVMHTGFTGTYLVIDRARQAFAVLLTNRVHAPRAAQPARLIRDVRADVSDGLALAVADAPGGPLPMPVAFRADTSARVWQTRPATPARVAAPRLKLATRRVGRDAPPRLTANAKSRRGEGIRRKARA
jgi:serine-type D-Ala-D-Ala carboxypeptidase